MDWNAFFQQTCAAAKVKTNAELAPRIGVTPAAVSHYRTGKRTPQVWTVAECLRIQGHPEPEKAAISIMKAAANTSPERAFWRRLAATATVIGCLALYPLDQLRADVGEHLAQSMHYAK